MLLTRNFLFFAAQSRLHAQPANDPTVDFGVFLFMMLLDVLLLDSLYRLVYHSAWKLRSS